MPVAGLASPVGPLWLTEEDGHLVALDRTCPSPVHCPPEAISLPGQPVASPLLHEAREQLAAYFAGRLRRFDLPLAPQGTPFQLRVWRALQDIPYGRTCSYAELAAAVGSPRACRAVGQANGRNPLMIVIPCPAPLPSWRPPPPCRCWCGRGHAGCPPAAGRGGPRPPSRRGCPCRQTADAPCSLPGGCLLARVQVLWISSYLYCRF